MRAVWQTLQLSALVARAFIREPAAVVGLIWHHHLGDRARAGELAVRISRGVR